MQFQKNNNKIANNKKNNHNLMLPALKSNQIYININSVSMNCTFKTYVPFKGNKNSS